MSYTSVEQVQRYLVSNFVVMDTVADQPITLPGTDPIRFWGCAVEASSVRVKSRRTGRPRRVSVVIADNDVTFASGPIVPDSVVVASDSSLGQVYIENADYVINYSLGLLSRKGGTLSLGTEVTVWFVPYHIYSDETDYAVDFDQATIHRHAGGEIASGETVHLDFTPVFKGFDDAIVANAVTEANGLIEREVDPDRQFGTDSALSAAATNRALAIICRIAAARELASGRGNDKIALAWDRLAEGYALQTTMLLSAFRPPFDGPSTPRNV